MRKMNEYIFLTQKSVNITKMFVYFRYICTTTLIQVKTLTSVIFVL